MSSEYKYLVGCTQDGRLTPHIRLTPAYQDHGQVSGAIELDGGTDVHVLDLTGDTTATITGGVNGMVCAVRAFLNGKNLTVEDFPAGEVTTLVRIRDEWEPIAGGGGGVRTVTPTAPTFTDDPAGGGIYTIPTSTGITYKVGGAVRAAGDYPVTGQTITVVASITDPDKYELAAGVQTQWSHTFSAGATLVAELDFAGMADTATPSGLTMSNGAAFTITNGSPQIKGGRFGVFDAASAVNATAKAVVQLPKQRVTLPALEMTQPGSGLNGVNLAIYHPGDNGRTIGGISVEAGTVYVSGYDSDAPWTIVAGSGISSTWVDRGGGYTGFAWSVPGVTVDGSTSLAVDWDSTAQKLTFWVDGTNLGSITTTKLAGVKGGGIRVVTAAWASGSTSIQRPQIWALP